MKTALRRIYFGLILFLMYAPIVTLVILSFNASKSRTKWGGFTLSWYVSLFQDEAIMSALYNTLVIALVSALLATLLGTAASIGISAMKPRAKTVFMGVTNIPILNSEIVTGISLMLLFIVFPGKEHTDQDKDHKHQRKTAAYMPVASLLELAVDDISDEEDLASSQEVRDDESRQGRDKDHGNAADHTRYA